MTRSILNLLLNPFSLRVGQFSLVISLHCILFRKKVSSSLWSAFFLPIFLFGARPERDPPCIQGIGCRCRLITYFMLSLTALNVFIFAASEIIWSSASISVMLADRKGKQEGSGFHKGGPNAKGSKVGVVGIMGGLDSPYSDKSF